MLQMQNQFDQRMAALRKGQMHQFELFLDTILENPDNIDGIDRELEV